jgi:predicted aspartyl protease
VLATIDTGCNGEARMAAGDASALGATLLEDAEGVELGRGRSANVRVGRLRISRPGAEREVAVLVGDREEPSNGEGRVLLIGTRLLSPHLLLIDFGAGTLETETRP